MAQEGEEVDDKKVVKDDGVGPRGVESRELFKQTSNVVKWFSSDLGNIVGKTDAGTIDELDLVNVSLQCNLFVYFVLADRY